MAFDQSIRNRLQKFVSNSRSILSEEFTRQLQATYGLDPKQGTVAEIKSLTHLDNLQRQTAHVLRETLAHYLTTTPGKSQIERTKQVLTRIVREQAFTVLNRIAALRMAEARGFLLESVSKAHSSKGFQLYRQLAGTSHGETGDAYRNYIFSLFDEFSLDLAALFDRYSSEGLLFPRESALLELLSEINHQEIEQLWAEDETIGWIYQYFNSIEERKKMRAESQAPRNSRELAVRNQFFTPRYVVEFLTDNTLGRIWYEMTQGDTKLIDSCRYLIRRPTEIFLKSDEEVPETEYTEDEALSQEELLKQPVYIPLRPLKDPRNIRMLDPACGSMHFGLYAFDLFECIYLEAWHLENELGPDAFERQEKQQALQTTFESIEDFKIQIPKLIIENNIHGVDIDSRATQIAGLSLWQRAQRAWYQQDIKSQQRPVIVKSNIVCAEPMPGEKSLLQEFTRKLNPPVLGQLLEVIFDKMQLAGEAGTLLKIEEEIQTAIKEASEQWQIKSGKNSIGDMFQEDLDAATPQKELGFDLSGVDDETFWDSAEHLILEALSNYADQAESNADQKRLFAEDAAKGFSFIDLCRKRFDVVLMNPPFGEGALLASNYLEINYGKLSSNLIARFIQRGKDLVSLNLGFVGVVLDRTVLIKNSYESLRTKTLLDDSSLDKVVDLGWNVLDANVEVSSIIINEAHVKSVTGIDATTEFDKKQILENWINTTILVPTKKIECFPNCAINLSMPSFFINALINFQSIEKQSIKFINGHTIKSDVFKRLAWEVPKKMYRSKYAIPMWNGSSYSPFRVSFEEAVLIKNYAGDLSNHKSTIYRSASRHFLPGLCYGKRGDYLDVQFIPSGFMYTNEGFGANVEGDILIIALSYLNSSIAQYFINLYCGQHKGVGYVNQLPLPVITKELLLVIKKNTKKIIEFAKNVQVLCLTDHEHISPIPIGLDEFDLATISKYIVNNYKSYLSALTKNDELFFQVFELDQDEKDQVLNEITRNRTRPGLYYKNKDDISQIQSDIGYSILCHAMDSCFNAQNMQVLCTSEFDVERVYSLVQSSKYLSQLNVEYIEEIFIHLDSPVKNVFNNTNFLFEFIYKVMAKGNRKAPIFWSLQTPSGSYTLWLYYHSLNEQSLYTCVNDFVDPKLQSIIRSLNAISNKSSRSNHDENKLAELTDLETELKNFRDELLRLAKFWKPNLNDGVQITAAPLWKLFQHKAWQKKLKTTWEKLENGDYDWAHLARSIWPERVLRKCHKDRSLAIAHDVETHFWHEVEVSIKRGKKLTGKTKLLWQPMVLTEPELDALVKKLILENES